MHMILAIIVAILLMGLTTPAVANTPQDGEFTTTYETRIFTLVPGGKTVGQIAKETLGDSKKWESELFQIYHPKTRKQVAKIDTALPTNARIEVKVPRVERVQKQGSRAVKKNDDESLGYGYGFLNSPPRMPYNERRAHEEASFKTRLDAASAYVAEKYMRYQDEIWEEAKNRAELEKAWWKALYILWSSLAIGAIGVILIIRPRSNDRVKIGNKRDLNRKISREVIAGCRREYLNMLWWRLGKIETLHVVSDSALVHLGADPLDTFIEFQVLRLQGRDADLMEKLLHGAVSEIAEGRFLPYKNLFRFGAIERCEKRDTDERWCFKLHIKEPDEHISDTYAQETPATA